MVHAPHPALSPASSVGGQASGLHLTADLYGCQGDQHLMHDAAGLQAFCQASVEAAGLTAVGCLFHHFGEQGGVTGVVVLAESHLCIHTWPEAAYVTLDVYVCNYSSDNRHKAEQLFGTLQRAFQAGDARLHRIERG
ncbi:MULTISPECIES: adenosylmethionine decarboxylase [Giesbergeria]|uniref:Adenosylmethionine decarboxylase n=1 Tax=Giesbergeria sinuosa TaxID=80883 RepID=A0ABV9QBQ1_9BURK